MRTRKVDTRRDAPGPVRLWCVDCEVYLAPDGPGDRFVNCPRCRIWVLLCPEPACGMHAGHPGDHAGKEPGA